MLGQFEPSSTVQALSPGFIDSRPRKDGFRMHGPEMTRIEVFVDAAWVPCSGFVLFLIGPWIPYVESRHHRGKEKTGDIND